MHGRGKGVTLHTFTASRRSYPARGTAGKNGCLIKQQQQQYRCRLFFKFADFIAVPHRYSLTKAHNPRRRYSLLAQIKSLTLLFLKSNLWSAVLPLLRFAAACVSIGSSAPIPARLSAGSIQHDGVRRLPEPFSPPGCGARHWRWAFYFFIGIRQSRTDGRSAPKRCWVTVSTGLTSFSLNFLACGLLGPP